MDAGALRAFEFGRILDPLGNSAKRPLKDERLRLLHPYDSQGGWQISSPLLRGAGSTLG